MERRAIGMVGDKSLDPRAIVRISKLRHAARRALVNRRARSCQSRPLAFNDHIHPAPAEIVHQLLQLWRHRLQIGIMAQPRFQRRIGHARLVRIDFPRVEIEDRRALLAPLLTCRIAQREKA